MIKIDTLGMQNFEPIIEKKKRDSFKLFLKCVVFAVIGAAVLSDIIYLFMNNGHANLREKAETAEPVLQQTEAVSSEEAVVWKDGWVKYNGGIYEYKDSTMNFLLMGIDRPLDGEKTADAIVGGQADFLALLVLDAEEEGIKLIPIDTKAMSAEAQTDLQTSVQTDSCEYQVKAVSNLLHQLPIHGYAALSLDGIVPLNDAVGGIDVVAPMDYASDDVSVKKGDVLHLEGADANRFLLSRDADLGGESGRLKRQTVYLTALVDSLYNKIKSDSLSLISMYNGISEYVVTDIGTNELAYLATQASKYYYDDESVLEIKGETSKEGTTEEFSVDEDALKDLIINTFYKKVR